MQREACMLLDLVWGVAWHVGRCAARMDIFLPHPKEVLYTVVLLYDTMLRQMSMLFLLLFKTFMMLLLVAIKW